MYQFTNGQKNCGPWEASATTNTAIGPRIGYYQLFVEIPAARPPDRSQKEILRILCRTPWLELSEYLMIISELLDRDLWCK